RDRRSAGLAHRFGLLPPSGQDFFQSGGGRKTVMDSEVGGRGEERADGCRRADYEEAEGSRTAVATDRAAPVLDRSAAACGIEEEEVGPDPIEQHPCAGGRSRDDLASGVFHSRDQSRAGRSLVDGHERAKRSHLFPPETVFTGPWRG